MDGDGGAYPLWRSFEWIVQNKDVRARVEAMACDTDNQHAAMHARILLDILEGNVPPVPDFSLNSAADVEILTVQESTRRSKEPGDGISYDVWRLTIGDDVDAFWNAPHRGKQGRMCYEKAGGRDNQGLIICNGVEYGTIRRKLPPMEGAVTAMCFIRIPEGDRTDGRVGLNLWQTCWSDHNPSPFRIVACPQPGVWTPVVLTTYLQTYSGRHPDYLLYELEIEGFDDQEQLEISQMTVWPLNHIGLLK